MCVYVYMYGGVCELLHKPVYGVKKGKENVQLDCRVGVSILLV